MTEYSLAFAPLVPAWALALLALLAVPALGYALLKGRVAKFDAAAIAAARAAA